MQTGALTAEKMPSVRKNYGTLPQKYKYPEGRRRGDNVARIRLSRTVSSERANGPTPPSTLATAVLNTRAFQERREFTFSENTFANSNWGKLDMSTYLWDDTAVIPDCGEGGGVAGIVYGEHNMSNWENGDFGTPITLPPLEPFGFPETSANSSQTQGAKLESPHTQFPPQPHAMTTLSTTSFPLQTLPNLMMDDEDVSFSTSSSNTSPNILGPLYQFDDDTKDNGFLYRFDLNDTTCGGGSSGSSFCSDGIVGTAVALGKSSSTEALDTTTPKKNGRGKGGRKMGSAPRVRRASVDQPPLVPMDPMSFIEDINSVLNSDRLRKPKTNLEPMPESFSTSEEYEAAFQDWRLRRERNNAKSRRSRMDRKRREEAQSEDLKGVMDELHELRRQIGELRGVLVAVPTIDV